MKTFHLILFLFLAVLAAAQPSTAADVQLQQLALPDDLVLDYTEMGPADGIPVIFLHGYTDSRHSFDPVLPYLSGSLRVFALSQRGHGDSGKEATNFRPEDLAQDVRDFMEKKGIPTAIVVGHSMGASVAQCFAVSYPARCRALVLIGAFARFDNKPDLLELLEAVREMQDPVDLDFITGFQQETLYKSVPDTFFQTVVLESTKVPVRVWDLALSGLLATDYRAALPQLNLPALLIWGDQDAFTPLADQQLLNKLIPRSELLIYEKTGHGVHWENPQRFAADLNCFVLSVFREQLR